MTLSYMILLASTLLETRSYSTGNGEDVNDVVKRSDCILVYGSTTKCGVVKRFDCTTRLESCLLLDVNHYYWCSLVIFQSKQIHRPKSRFSYSPC